MQVGMNAVFLAFGIPFLVLIVVLFVASRFMSEEVAALLSIACLIPYYIILYLLRDKLRERFTFRIE